MDTWNRIEALFADALERSGPDRAAFLDAACADAPDLRAEVEAMLDAHDTPLGIEPRLLPDEAAPVAGTHVGPYRLLRHLGSGGMGSVWLAEHATGPLDRQVALKLVRLPYAPTDARALRRRFEAERRILARLEHPGIVRLLEAGTGTPTPTAPTGAPYFAMDYVAGTPITDYADAHGLGVADRLRLVLQVCEAVHHAHQRLVVHRDLKPSNLLVSDDGRRPVVKLLDFGIAKLLDDGQGEDSQEEATQTSVRPMTRAYAAPEQIRGEPVTTATDIYALGVVLFELLAGRRPFEAPIAAALEEAILTRTPPRPSAVAQDAASGLAAAPRRADLDAVVLTALRKAPGERYGSAAALATDLQRVLDGRPVVARPASAAYRTRLFVRRHRVAVAASVAGLVLLVAFTVALAVQQRATARERDTAEATAAFLADLFAAADPLAGERLDTLRVPDLLDLGVERARADLAEQPFVRARLLGTIGRAYNRLGHPPEAIAPLTEAVTLLREGGDAGALARGLTELAAAHNTQGRSPEAERLVREALALPAARADPATQTRAEHVLALTLLNLGRPDEALALLDASLARPLAEADRFLMEQTRARALLDLGRLDEAERQLLDARARHAQRHGSDDARLIGVLNPLTFLYLMQGRVDEAEAVGAEAVALMRSAQPGSSTLSQTLAVYAAVLRRQDQLAAAEALLREALALPALRPDAHAAPLGTLASVLHEQGRLAEAIDTQAAAVALLTTEASGLPTSAVYSRVKLGRLLREAGRYGEAEQVLLAAAGGAPDGAAGHPGGASVVDELVALYEAWGRPAEADAWRTRPDAAGVTWHVPADG